jgi:hypothetical protein
MTGKGHNCGAYIYACDLSPIFDRFIDGVVRNQWNPVDTERDRGEILTHVFTHAI